VSPFSLHNYFLSQRHPVNAAGVATVIVLSLPQRHARMLRSVDGAAHRLMKAAAETMCGEELIAQLNCSRLAVRPNRRHFKRTGREFLSIVWRQSVAAAKFFHRLYPPIRMIDPCSGSNVIGSQMPAREQAILLLTKCDAPGVISSCAASATLISFEHTLTEYIESRFTWRNLASSARAPTGSPSERRPYFCTVRGSLPRVHEIVSR
jgi:hypothetical protein